MALLQKAYLGSTALFRNEDWFEDGSPIIINKPNNALLTADTNAHTKGAWTQIIASTSADVSLLFLNASAIFTSATNTATLLDIATGASGSETIIAENIAVGGAGTAGSGSPGIAVSIPLKIPSGTRVAARMQSVVTGGKQAVLQSAFIDAGDYTTAPTTVDVIGGDTVTSQGISFSGASGTWVEAIASTSQVYRAVVFVPSLHTDTAASLNTAVFDIGVGASGSEVAFGTARVLYTTSEQVFTGEPFNTLFGRNIPAGSRLAVKHNIAANPDRYGFTLIGIP